MIRNPKQLQVEVIAAMQLLYLTADKPGLFQDA